MYIKNQISIIRKTLYGIMLLAVLLSTFGAGSLSSAGAQEVTAMPTDYILSDGQFVYGPNVGDFNLRTYLEDNAPHLLKYADDLYGRSEYFSINPKVYITLLEVHAHLISTPDLIRIEDPFELPDMDFISQIDYISNAMVDAYYLHLNSYTPLPASQRNLSPFITQSGELINIASDTNAGTYAIIAALAGIKSEKNISQILDNNRSDGFYQTYIKLFGNDDPADGRNHIYTPGEVGALAAPDNLLQLPYLQGLSWKFGGVHDNNGGGGIGSPFNDASALDFYPGVLSWGADTSNMWVVASASGTPTKVSACYFKILHSDGWETTYYHLENIQSFSGSINQNDKIGVIANTLAEATCTGGGASGPHVHFTLRHNGVLVAINGTPLSGWYVHSGRWNYDTDPNYMWLERAGLKKYPYGDLVLSDVTIPATFVDVPAAYWAWDFIERLYNSGVTSGCSTTPLTYCPLSPVTRAQMAIFILRGLHGSAYVPPAATGAIFSDVPINSFGAAWIEQFALEGITSGCGDGMYCPDENVTRAQMAIFLMKGTDGPSYIPPAATGVFSDVPVGSFAADWIEQFAAEGITSGCGGGDYCPNANVTRDQMAVFLVKAFNLP